MSADTSMAVALERPISALLDEQRDIELAIARLENRKLQIEQAIETTLRTCLGVAVPGHNGDCPLDKISRLAA